MLNDSIVLNVKHTADFTPEFIAENKRAAQEMAAAWDRVEQFGKEIETGCFITAKAWERAAERSW